MANMFLTSFIALVLFSGSCLSDLQQDFSAAENDVSMHKKRAEKHYGSDNDVISKLIDHLTSSINKKDVVDTEINKLYDELTRRSDESCKDQFPNCERLMPEKNCFSKTNQMMSLCAKTCGFCQRPKLPACATSTYGCCWDMKHEKASTAGENCRPCRDDYKTLCETFQEDCQAIRARGDFMRFHCPQSCNLCAKRCSDYGNKKYLCKYWKSKDWCESNKDVMNYYCKKTCGYC